MRFASIGGQSNYAVAGKAVADDAARIFDTARSNSVDFGKLAQTSRDMKSRENAALSAADAQVASQKVKSDASIKVAKEEIYRDELRAKSRRKAGVVAALGKAGAGLADVFVKPEKRDFSSIDALIEKNRTAASKYDAQAAAVNTDFKSSTSSSSSSTSGTNTGGTGASSTSTVGAGGSKNTFDPGQTSAFDITGKYESDSSGGYNAYNLGGSKGGTVAHGSGDSSKTNAFGQPLTSMTIGSIKQLQAQGKLHAAGRFQFIGNSLPEAARFAGLSDTDTFSPENQNKMFLAFGNKYGTSRWVGLDKATPEERATVQSAFDNWKL